MSELDAGQHFPITSSALASAVMYIGESSPTTLVPAPHHSSARHEFPGRHDTELSFLVGREDWAQFLVSPFSSLLDPLLISIRR